jgi:hypothetical protein
MRGKFQGPWMRGRNYRTSSDLLSPITLRMKMTRTNVSGCLPQAMQMRETSKEAIVLAFAIG